MTIPTPEQLETWTGHEAIDKNEKTIGKITDVYIDELSGKPEWIAVNTGLFGTRVSFAPLAGAQQTETAIKVAHDKSTIKDSPNIEANGELSMEEESRLFRHYGMRYDDDAGSVSVTEDVTPQMARRRLRRRDEAAVDYVDLDKDSLKHDEQKLKTNG
jgi:hypothetical protein